LSRVPSGPLIRDCGAHRQAKAPGLFGSKFGSVTIARISPVRGRVTTAVMLMGVCFCSVSASASFHDVLDRRVNGKHHVQAVAGLHVFIAQRDQFAASAGQFASRASPPRRSTPDSKSVSTPSRPTVCETWLLPFSVPVKPSTCAASGPFDTRAIDHPPGR